MSSAAIVFLGAIAPGLISSGSGLALLRVPLEALLALVILAVLPRGSASRVVASLAAIVFVATIVSAALDRGFLSVLGRPVNVVSVWPELVSAYGVLSDSTAPAVAAVIVGLLVLAVAVVVLVLTRALLQLAEVIRGRARARRIGATAIAAGWIVLAVVGAQVVPGLPVAAADSVRMTMAKVDQVTTAASDVAAIERAATIDDFEKVQASDLLGGLKGKDVIIAFIESYGQVAVQDTAFSKGVTDVLLKGTADLAAHGYSNRSAFLSSSTFGGASWLAHSTLQTGLWIDSQHIYDQVTSGSRLTLSAAFKKAGWRTVGVAPSNSRPWPIGESFYRFDFMADSQNMGYQGPRFSYARMPDQFTWAYFQKNELAEPHPPVMAEIAFVSSHHPWTPLPYEVPWESIRDGSIFDPQPAQGLAPTVVWQSEEQVQQLYGQSIEYSMSVVFSFLTTFDNPNLVVIVLGDHQPASVVSGLDANHAVPISIISKDPSVIDRIASWGWDPGMLPSPDAPLWRMDEFRDRFLTAFRQ
ncbi:MAG: CDP-alcohol phosphatidyltransferase [Salinibacterium sp.]|nr:CDP-alcohol phosphatidyltransferase [Salinibacterium sp.]